MAYCDEFLKNGITFLEEDIALLNDWYEQTKDIEDDFLPRLMCYEEAMQFNYYEKTFEGFPAGQMIPLWTVDYLSGAISYYYSGPLKGMIMMEHEETDLSPRCQSLRDFLAFYKKAQQVGKLIKQQGTYKEEKEIYEDAADYYTHHFWDIGDYQIRELTKEEKQGNYEKAIALMEVWKEGNYPENEPEDAYYQQLGFCVVKILPDEYCHLLIPYLNKEEDDYVLGAICRKIEAAKYYEALEAVEALAKIDGNEVYVDGCTNGFLTKRVCEALRTI
ncbi:MAG: hypothetical protein J6F30_15325 [Cellulosilyticum sp.]|nr:hypothetical protein [Cellulosilyticum sp.]